MADEMNKEREAAETWLRDRYGAYRGHFAWRELEEAFLAGRASLAASAGSEPVAWLVPQLHTFKGAERVHFTRAPGCTMTDAELIEYMDGRVMWLPTTFCDSENVVTDKFGVTHKPKPLYTHPSPPEGAGWTKAKDQLPPCIDGQLYIGINSAGFACMFNAITSDIGGDVHCLYETGEESIDMMGCLDIWQPFNPPAPTASEAKGA